MHVYILKKKEKNSWDLYSCNFLLMICTFIN